ncbi:hypothetical protein AJ80_02312 [Polytolypa hystricis UAMH7299]|uniref:Uncharacterized protein n=1 Tax=Polytolypa hystricis (strain UAMH7299) TaxID=1447883 RepID=A0A2B7YPV6_POLH7|nr:hypothetical protein AJ80_02312 [Polytolypa hystricis UAMH7299]
MTTRARANVRKPTGAVLPALPSSTFFPPPARPQPALLPVAATSGSRQLQLAPPGVVRANGKQQTLVSHPARLFLCRNPKSLLREEPILVVPRSTSNATQACDRCRNSNDPFSLPEPISIGPMSPPWRDLRSDIRRPMRTGSPPEMAQHLPLEIACSRSTEYEARRTGSHFLLPIGHCGEQVRPLRSCRGGVAPAWAKPNVPDHPTALASRSRADA